MAVRHWRRLASSLRVDPDVFVAGFADMADRLPDLARSSLEQTRREGLSSEVLPRLVDDISRRASECRNRLTR